MHSNQDLTLIDWKQKYPESFYNCKVLELGSLYVNGTVRPHFDNCEYVGIDKQPGRCVDLVVEAKNTNFIPEYFDTLISFSMFEHDPEWKESIENNLKWIKPNGMIFISYGAEGNPPHFHGGFHIIIPHKEFISFLNSMGVEVIESYWEEDRFGKQNAGSYNILAIKK